MLATTEVFPPTVIHLPLIPVATVLRVMREIFFVENSMTQRRSSQLKSAEEPFVLSQRLGVPKAAVSKLFTVNLDAINAVRI